jgi:hypothetical protein
VIDAGRPDADYVPDRKARRLEQRAVVFRRVASTYVAARLVLIEHFGLVAGMTRVRTADVEHAAWPQNPKELRHHVVVVVEMLQHLEADDFVEAARFARKIVEVCSFEAEAVGIAAPMSDKEVARPFHLGRLDVQGDDACA